MLAWPAKGKLVKLAKACLPRPRSEQPFGRRTNSQANDQLAAHIESSLLLVSSSGLGFLRGGR
jgi:hypothetical protein